jgi:hypothetical protein
VCDAKPVLWRHLMGLSDFLCVEPYTTARQGEEQVWPRTIHRFSPKIC